MLQLGKLKMHYMNWAAMVAQAVATKIQFMYMRTLKEI